MRIRTKLAIKCAQGVHGFILKMGRGSGVTLPGYIARLIDPKILSELSKEVKLQVFATLGTNGKTTTNNILYHTLKANGYQVISNRTGSNMLNGIISAFVLSADKNCRINADYACIEVDEVASVGVLPQIQPDITILTNISRDQLDRVGEVDLVFRKLQEAISKIKKTTLMINGDDVLSYVLALKSKQDFVTYGINEQVFPDAGRSEIRESIFCQMCGEKLSYQFYHYGQLGMYECGHCGLKRPEIHYEAKNIVIEEKRFAFDVRDIHINANASTSYNIYNTLAAFAGLHTAKVNLDKFPQMIEDFDFSNNRESHFMISGADVQLHLAKNPIGFQQKIAMILKDPNPKDIVILINDEYQDGEDVSWLWDVDFQYLAEEQTKEIMAVGTRKYDMCLRLKYEDIVCKPAASAREAVEKLVDHGTGNLYVITNYTGIYSTNAMLRKLEELRKGCQN